MEKIRVEWVVNCDGESVFFWVFIEGEVRKHRETESGYWVNFVYGYNYNGD